MNFNFSPLVFFFLSSNIKTILGSQKKQKLRRGIAIAILWPLCDGFLKCVSQSFCYFFYQLPRQFVLDISFYDAWESQASENLKSICQRAGRENRSCRLPRLKLDWALFSALWPAVTLMKMQSRRLEDSCQVGFWWPPSCCNCRRFSSCC